MYASNVESVEKKFLGNVIHCISAKKKNFKSKFEQQNGLSIYEHFT